MYGPLADVAVTVASKNAAMSGGNMRRFIVDKMSTRIVDNPFRKIRSNGLRTVP